VLEVSGVARADVADFVSLIQPSPLDRLLDALFAEARGEGQWEVQIAHMIPLLDTDATKVSVSVVLDRWGISVLNKVSGLSDVTGTMSCSGVALIAGGVSATALGGRVSM